tara:strand:+ start:620 stop:2791 length:2172 start_codon:yes stop_codon:yes gene_type:complete
MKSELFQHEMTETSAIFGRNENVQVVFRGDGAFTDGNTINLPSLIHGAEVDKDTMSVMRGYTDHEAGHVKHTDFDEVNRFGNKDCINPDGTRNDFLFGLANAIEDIWLEKKIFNDYPGAEKNVSSTASAVNKSFLDRKDAKKLAKDWLSVLGVAITWEGRKDYDGIQHTQECLDLLDDDFKERLEGWVEKIESSKCTQDNTKLANEIYKEVMAEDKKRQPKPENNEGEGEGEGKPKEKPHGEDETDGNRTPEHEQTTMGDGEEQEAQKDTTENDGQGASQGDEKSSDAEANSDKGDEGSQKGAEKSDGEDGDQQGNGTKQSNPEHGDDTTEDPTEDKDFEGGGVGATNVWGQHEPFDHGFDKEVEKATKEMENKAQGGVFYKPYTTTYDAVITKDTFFHEEVANVLSNPNGDARYKKKLKQQTGTANVIRRRIERALSAKMNRGWDQGREFGRLDNKRLVGAFNGQTNVYKEREPMPEIDTAVTMLVDCSGSMDGYPLELAQEVAIALTEAIERTMVQYEILGFTTCITDYVQSPGERFKLKPESTDDDRFNDYARTGVLTGYVFKSFDEQLRLAKRAIGNMTKVWTAANTDGESVLWALNRLHKRREARKVLLVLSDGYPASGWYNGKPERIKAGMPEPLTRVMTDEDHLRYAVDRAKKEGVDCIGIGIDSSAVEQFYPDYVVVHKLEDLEKEALGKLAKALLGERYEVDNSKLLKVQNAVA